MSSPKVTFFVPCYKLAHLLTACVESILAQTYGDFEVLIMDDCSPDNTPEVARSFTDPRVRHIRNEPNLGHLRNYNKAIALAAGEYVWLISADDRLRSPVVLERYLEVMEAHPRVGFAFCPGVGLQGEQETGIVKYGWLPGPDAVLDGRAFLHRLLESNCVLAPAGLVRKECYERVGVFPLDLPFAGDWYLWCAFALHYDVAYFAEPMVNYREHTESMTGQFIAEDMLRLSSDELEVRWRMKEMIDRAGGDTDLARHCMRTIINEYSHVLASKKWRGAKFRLSLQEFDRSLATHVGDPEEREAIRGQVLAQVGRRLHWEPDLQLDLRLYQLAIAHGGTHPKLWLQYAILRLGRLGRVIMGTAAALRALARGRQTKGA